MKSCLATSFFQITTPKIIQICAGTFLSSRETFFCRKLKNDIMSFLDQCNVETTVSPLGLQGLSCSKVTGFEGGLFQTLFKGHIFCFLVISFGRQIFELFARETILEKKRSVILSVLSISSECLFRNLPIVRKRTGRSGYALTLLLLDNLILKCRKYFNSIALPLTTVFKSIFFSRQYVTLHIQVAKGSFKMCKMTGQENGSLFSTKGAIKSTQTSNLYLVDAEGSSQIMLSTQKWIPNRKYEDR